MKINNTGSPCCVSILTIICLTSAGTVSAKGYSPTAQTPIGGSEEVERRLSRIEDQQKKLERALIAEFPRLRADLDDTTPQHVVRTSVQPTK